MSAHKRVFLRLTRGKQRPVFHLLRFGKQWKDVHPSRLLGVPPNTPRALLRPLSPAFGGSAVSAVQLSVGRRASGMGALTLPLLFVAVDAE